ncbi:hypothetical protein CS379_07710 [Methylobacterium frigidaeris]|uniref:Uncharacterized protein n=1 Tax=Methylobacterium frigidaeris TaxID=2038277 RepID=A0AA37HC04_9HYPH|nr:hypothetical protein CS379_07710 [Methylobacterium frigidaeris]GJD62445.1 hypothetical protein MPEAHAMD_2598 [Methylobacterium frigidaeris]
MTKRRASLPPLSDEEEAEIQAGIAQDADNPEITAERFARMRPAADVLPPALYAAPTRPRGPDRRPRSGRGPYTSMPRVARSLSSLSTDVK